MRPNMFVGKCRITLLTIALLSFSYTSIEAATLGLAWDRSGDGVTTGYVIKYGTASGSYTRTIDVGNVTTYSISTLTDGVRYYFAVQGYNASRQYGPLSSEVSGIAGTATGLPAPPSSLTATVNGTGINLAWRAPSGSVSGYRIEMGTSSGQSNVRTINTGTATTYTVSALAAGTYYIRVRSVNSTGVSAPSNEVQATVAGTSTSTVPPPPSNLAGTVRSNNYVDLTWVLNGTVTGYRVEVGSSSGLRDVRTITNAVRASSYTLTGLATGRYYIRVRSSNSVGFSAPSNEVVVTIGSPSTGTTVPPPPSNLAATVRSNNYVDLTWVLNGTVTGYRVEVGSSSGLRDVRTITNAVTATSYTLTGLATGRYYIRVRSSNSVGFSAPSNEVIVTIGTTGVPPPPSNLAATVRSNNYVDLTWVLNGTVTGYRVEVGSSSGLRDVRTITNAVRASSYTLTGLTTGRYYIRVRSSNSAGLSAPSNEVVVTIGSTTTALASPMGTSLSSPTQLKATRRDGNVIDVSWEAHDDSARYYRVEIGTARSQTDVSSFTTGVTTSVSISGLPARTYYIRVRAGNEDGFSEPTEELVLAGPDATDAPRRLSAVAGANGAIRLVWDAPQDATGITGYLLEAGRAPGRADFATHQTTDRSFTSGLVADGTYFVRVRSLTAAGPGSASNEIVVHVGTPQQCTARPAAPRLAAVIIGTQVHLSWAPGVGDRPTGYILDVGTSPGRRDVTSIPLGANVTTLTTEAPNGVYALLLTAINACGASEAGSESAVTIGGPEIAAPDAPFNLSQQVNGGTATLSWLPATTGGEAASYVIEVVSPAGQVLLSIETGNTSTTFTHGAVPPGEYAVRVRGVNARGAGPASDPVIVTIQ